MDIESFINLYHLKCRGAVLTHHDNGVEVDVENCGSIL